MMTRRQIVKRIVWVACVLLLVSCCFLSFRTSVGIAERPEDAPISGLPQDAHDVRWYRPGAFGNNYTYDFATSENAFRQWAAEWTGVPLRGPDAGPSQVLRYNHELHRLEFYDIPDAIAFGWSKEDRGVYLVYDRAKGRAYYHTHSR